MNRVYKDSLLKSIKNQKARLKEIMVETVDLKNTLHELERERVGLEGNIQHEKKLLKNLNS